MEDMNDFNLPPSERSREFSSSKPVTASIPLMKKIKLVWIALIALMLPKASETAHSSDYLAWFRTKTAPYETDSWRHVVKNMKSRKQAQYENTKPVIVAGRRIHKYMIGVAVVLFLLAGVAFRLFKISTGM